MKGFKPVVVSWAQFQPRTAALAVALGGQAVFVHSRRLARTPLLAPLRYALESIRTWRLLGRLHADAVIVVSPPLPAALTAATWATVHRRPWALDCHTGAYTGRKWGWTLPAHRLLFRGAAAVMFNTPEETATAKRWGARAIHVPDDLPDPAEAVAVPRASCPRIFIAGSFDESEPIDAVLDAAARLPDVEVRLAGDPARLPATVRASAPRNAVFTGYLPYARFLGEMCAADVVAVFSDDGVAYRLNRATCEAVGLARPLVLLDTPGNHSNIGAAAFLCAADPDSIARALESAILSQEELAGRIQQLRTRMQAERLHAIEKLQELLRGDIDGRAKRQTVLFITEHVYPFHSIIRRNVDELLAQGAEVDLVCMTSSNVPSWPADHPSLRVHRIRLDHHRTPAFRYLFEYFFFFFAALPIVMALSARRRYAVVQVDNLPDFLILAALPARWRGARVVMHFHELTPELLSTRLRLSSGHPMIVLATWLERRASALADHCLVPSAACARILAGRGVAPERISVVPNMVAQTNHLPHVPRPPAPVLITHGSLIERYGVQIAIRAMAELKSVWPGLTLRVLGDGEYRPRLETLVAELGLERQVVFGGFLAWSDAMAEVRAATIGLVPVITDGYGELLLPTKLFDYVTAGIPAVCARLDTIVEHFPPDSVAYFPPGDHNALAMQVDYLLRHPDAARAQAARAREIACPEKVAQSYLSALGLAAASSNA
jgi:glycosyltransferase involved in cell wall biosynthesis